MRDEPQKKPKVNGRPNDSKKQANTTPNRNLTPQAIKTMIPPKRRRTVSEGSAE